MSFSLSPESVHLDDLALADMELYMSASDRSVWRDLASRSMKARDPEEFLRATVRELVQGEFITREILRMLLGAANLLYFPDERAPAFSPSVVNSDEADHNQHEYEEHFGDLAAAEAEKRNEQILYGAW